MAFFSVNEPTDSTDVLGKLTDSYWLTLIFKKNHLKTIILNLKKKKRRQFSPATEQKLLLQSCCEIYITRTVSLNYGSLGERHGTSWKCLFLSNQ